MPHTIKVEMQYAVAGSNNFITLGTESTFTAVDHPSTPSSSQFQRFTEAGANTGLTAKITPNLGATVGGGHPNTVGSYLPIQRDISLGPGAYQFRNVVTIERTYNADNVPGNSSGTHTDFVNTATGPDNVVWTTFGTTNTAPLSAYIIDTRYISILAAGDSTFSTEMTVDRTDVDILQPTDELLFHWQFNDISGNFITESVSGQDGEAES